jgi:putative sterol carrier protein
MEPFMQQIESISKAIQQRMTEGGLRLDRSLSISVDGAPSIFIEGDSVALRDSGEGSDCDLRMSPQDLVALVTGELDKTEAFMTGRIVVKGDMAVAMKLSELF